MRRKFAVELGYGTFVSVKHVLVSLGKGEPNVQLSGVLMQREMTKSSMTLVLLFSAFAVVTAIVILAIAVFTGRTTSFEDATRFEQRTTPDVRYVINYEIEPELFSFYTNERQAASPGAAVAQNRTNSAIR